MPLLDALLNRNSVQARHLQAPGPTDAALETMVKAALTAPDHGGLRPWRFIRIPDERRAALAALFAAAAEPGTEDRAREKAGYAPTLLAVVAVLKPAHPTVPLREQYASAGAAITHLLLAANALGFDAIMLSGKRVTDRGLLAALGIRPPEELMGFLSIGTAAPDKKKQKSRPVLTDHLTVWDGDP